MSTYLAANQTQGRSSLTSVSPDLSVSNVPSVASSTCSPLSATLAMTLTGPGIGAMSFFTDATRFTDETSPVAGTGFAAATKSSLP